MSIPLFSPAPPARPPSGRDPLDRDYTPPDLARAIVAAVDAVVPIDGTVWEPHAGGGAFARALLAQTPARLILSDLDPHAPGLGGWSQRPGADRIVGAIRGIDFLDENIPFSPAWIVGNPPYSEAEAHTRRALSLSRHVVFLLRAGFLETAGRMAFWADHPARHVWICGQRPSFRGGPTDATCYAIIWWDQQHAGPTTLTPGWDWRGAALALGGAR